MPNITLTDPTTGTTVASGLFATNHANLRALLNSGLDYVNLKGNPQLVAGEFPVWDGTQFVRSSGSTYTALKVPIFIGSATAVSVAAGLNNLVVTETLDPMGWHTPGSGNVVVGPGSYLCVASVSFDPNATGIREVRIYESGTTVIASELVAPAGAGSPTEISVSGLFSTGASLNNLQVWSNQSSGGALNTTLINFGVLKVG